MNSRPDRFLSLIRSAHRGRHKIYLGYSAGVGKTCQMLKEALRLRDEEGLDVVIGLVETHGRAETAACKGDLEEVPRRKTVYRNVTVEEMNLDAILVRHPQVVLVDELTHTNVPGSVHVKRYQDVETILEAGINVISTLNVQHLEGLYDVVEKTTGIRVKERIPDWVVARADEVVNVDISTEDLRERIRTGRVYPRERIETALNRFFVDGNLRQLRELALRELASHLDVKLRDAEVSGNGESRISPDQVLVCLSDDPTDAETLLRFGSRLAGRLNRNWYVLTSGHRLPPKVRPGTGRRSLRRCWARRSSSPGGTTWRMRFSSSRRSIGSGMSSSGGRGTGFRRWAVCSGGKAC